MGIWDTLKSHGKAQFLDVIQWLDDSDDTIVYRFPTMDSAITDNSKLIVREGQAAVFVSEGTLSDVFGPGTYTLDTRNTPIVSFFQSIAYALNYPYKGEIYFINTKQFRENKWGTANPFMMRDAEFGPVRVRAFGIYSYRVTDPATFLRQVVGTDGLFTTDEINGQLKRKLVSGLADSIGEAKIPVLDLAAQYMDLGDLIRDRMLGAFEEAYGITLTDMTIENISLPPEVEKALDQRTKMGVLGNLDKYAKMKAAEALETAAGNQGMGGAGVGMGVGIGMGNMMGNMMSNMGGGQSAPPAGGGAPPPLPQAQTFHYNGPSGQAQLNPSEIITRIQADRNANHMIWANGWANWKSWKDVPEIANQIPPEMAPPPPPAPPAPSAAVMYHYHGPAGQGEKSIEEVAAILRADPEGAHNVWQKGWDAWKAAKDVAEIQSEIGDGPPPPPM